MKDNRRRNQTLTVRLTETEKEMICRKADRAKLSLTDYVLAACVQKEIRPAEDVKPLLIELKRIGNNLNQIARKVNVGAFHSADFQDVLDGQKMIYEELCRLARRP